MLKKAIVLGWLLQVLLLPAQGQDINLGGINFPKAFLHAGKEFPAGIYGVVLTTKDSLPFFNVFNSSEGLMFEELAIVKGEYRGGKKLAFKLRKGFVKGEEYFRIKVTRPGQMLLAYFLVKK